MADEVLSQSMIDSLLQSSPAEGNAKGNKVLSSEVGDLLAQGRKNREEQETTSLPPLPSQPQKTEPASTPASEEVSASKPVETPKEVAPNSEEQTHQAAIAVQPADTAKADGDTPPRPEADANVGTIQTVVAPPAELPDMGTIILPLQAAIDALTQRVQNTEVSMQQIEGAGKAISTNVQASSQSSNLATAKALQMEKEIASINNRIQQLSHDLQTAMNVFESLNSQISTITRGLRGTIGYDIRENFECEGCGSRGYVTELVKCSNCGEEEWWGWWPPEEE